MRFVALASDYDGTIAVQGRVDAETLQALREVRESGRRLILVTGRHLDDLMQAFPEAGVFDRIVGENGGVLYRPETHERILLTRPPDERLVRLIRERGIEPVDVGQAVIASDESRQKVLLEAIHELGLELQLIFNKGSLMILPSGVNKASGLLAALSELDLSADNVVGVGDAENDHAFLELCECGVAVGNALPALKEEADLVTEETHGAGVQELIHRLLDDEDGLLSVVDERHRLALGEREGGEVRISVHGPGVLVAGPSGSGKSTVSTALLEQLHERAYQVVVIDPEGDYEELSGAAVLGTAHRPPDVQEVVGLLRRPDQSIVVNMVGMQQAERPGLFAALLPELLKSRAATGRPHWIQIDEAHHLLPASLQTATQQLPKELRGLLLVTVHPDMVAPPVLEDVGVVVAVGPEPAETLGGFASATGRGCPPAPDGGEDEQGMGGGDRTAVFWRPGEAPFRFVPARPRRQMIRHRRKYAQGELRPEDSFYFKGPDDRLDLMAQNLFIFLQIAEGVDDETWLYHLGRHDYSAWLREKIRDDELADAVHRIEDDETLDAHESISRVRAEIEDRYTTPV